MSFDEYVLQYSSIISNSEGDQYKCNEGIDE